MYEDRDAAADADGQLLRTEDVTGVGEHSIGDVSTNGTRLYLSNGDGAGVWAATGGNVGR